VDRPAILEGNSIGEIAHRWDRVVVQLDPVSELLTGIDYYRNSSPAPQLVKRFRIEARERRQGVWTPTRIVTHRRSEQSTTLTLLESDFQFSRARDLRFAPDELPKLGAWLEAKVR
jgi:hypothetical protein